MAEIGKYNTLEVLKEVDFGLYLDGGKTGEILLPKRYIPEGARPGSLLEVFIYLDSEDRPVATTEKPLARAGQFACLKCIDVTRVGAFVDWGLPKNLLVPFREQKQPMEVGKAYVVYVYFDMESQRMTASAKVEKFIDSTPAGFTEGEEVELMVYAQTDLGYKAIVNDAGTGILYKNEVFLPVRIGQKLTGYVKKVREDQKIDLMLLRPGYEKVGEMEEQILSFIRNNGGFTSVTDKSSPEIIYDLFGMSKKNYKKALGALYKKRLVNLEPEGVRLT